MGVTAITSKKQFDDLLNSGKLFIIDFWATWCGPCLAISPVLEKLSDDSSYNEKIEFYKVDVDEQSEISQEVGIRAMPTFIVFKDGQKHGELVGANPEGLKQLLNKAL